MGTMIPSFLKAAKPFRKYETTAARERTTSMGFHFFMTKVLETERLKKKLLLLYIYHHACKLTQRESLVQ